VGVIAATGGLCYPGPRRMHARHTPMASFLHKENAGRSSRRAFATSSGRNAEASERASRLFRLASVERRPRKRIPKERKPCHRQPRFSPNRRSKRTPNNPLPRRLTDLPKEAQKARPRVRGLLQLLIGMTRLRMLGNAMRLKFARPQLCMNGDMLVLVGYGNLL
jgi:hypothetical protein